MHPKMQSSTHTMCDIKDLELTKHITQHANGEPLLKWSSSHSHSSSSATIPLVVWSRCTLHKKILDLLNKESISGVRSGRASLQIRRQVYCKYLKRCVDC